MTRKRNALLALSLCAGLIPGAALAADNNEGADSRNAAAGSLVPNTGHFLCTAAINSNGIIATHLNGGRFDVINPLTTARLATGTYQVGFKGPCANVQIQNGWFRVVQPDLLAAGSLPATSCTVADRVGVVSALLIRCFNAAGAAIDTPFTVSVSR